MDFVHRRNFRELGKNDAYGKSRYVERRGTRENSGGMMASSNNAMISALLIPEGQVCIRTLMHSETFSSFFRNFFI